MYKKVTKLLYIFRRNYFNTSAWRSFRLFQIDQFYTC